MLIKNLLNKIKLNKIKVNLNLNLKFANRSNDFCSEQITSLDIKKDLIEQKKINKEFDLPSKKFFNEYNQESKGFVYDKKPIKIKCKENKIYMWCSCGHSKNQPFCDGTHRIQHYKIDLKPIPFKCFETKEYWFCNCKQTKNRPFCDGTHKEKFVQNSDSFIKF